MHHVKYVAHPRLSTPTPISTPSHSSPEGIMSEGGSPMEEEVLPFYPSYTACEERAV